MHPYRIDPHPASTHVNRKEIPFSLKTTGSTISRTWEIQYKVFNKIKFLQQNLRDNGLQHRVIWNTTNFRTPVALDSTKKKKNIGGFQNFLERLMPTKYYQNSHQGANAETDSFTTIFEDTFAIFLISKINTQVGFKPKT